MSVWKKLITAVKGGVTEAGEAVADSQALRILDQELRDAKSELKKSETSLTSMLAKEKLSNQKVADIQKSVTEHEGYVAKALEQNNEALALEVAEKIAEFESTLEQEKAIATQYKSSTEQLRASIKKAHMHIKRMEQQIDTVKATDAVQKAQVSVSTNHLGTNAKLKTAVESLDRIKEKQQLRAAEIEVAETLSAEGESSDLEKKLKEAGITQSSSSANDILNRIKSKG